MKDYKGKISNSPAQTVNAPYVQTNKSKYPVQKGTDLRNPNEKQKGGKQ